MTGLPTSQVLLDDGSGTYAADITAYVLASEGVTVSGHGRTDEFDQAPPATLSLVLDNTDGSLTNGVGFDVLVFGDGQFGGGVSVTPGQGIRFKETLGATTSTRFTGRISALDLGWPGGSQTNAAIAVTAVDPLAALGRREMRSMLEEEILSHSPSRYYTLGEAEGSTSVGDSSGDQASSLTPAGTGAAIVFGNGTGPVDGLPAPTFNAGQYLTDGATGTVASPTVFGLGCTFNGGGADQSLVYQSGWQLSLLFDGELVGSAPGYFFLSGPPVTDGHTHRAELFGDGATAYLLLDGAVVASSSLYASSGFTGRRALLVGGLPSDFNPDAGFVGTISHVTSWPSLSTASAAAIGQASSSNFSGDTTAQRLGRIATYVGVTTATTTGMSGQLMGAQATSGSSAYDALQAVAAAEGGVLYARGDGTVVLQGRNYRAQKTTADLTLPSDDVGSDSAVTYDTQQVVNKVAVTRTDGATQTVQDLPSIAANGLYQQSIDLAVAQDSDALLAAQWLVAIHKSPSIRLGSAAFDLATSPAAEQILARDVGDRLSLTPMPSQMWAGAGDVTLEGWTETLTHEAWTVTANLLPFGLFDSFILDNATYGVLDSATPLGY